jgi:hypothetical protein
MSRYHNVNSDNTSTCCTQTQGKGNMSQSNTNSNRKMRRTRESVTNVTNVTAASNTATRPDISNTAGITNSNSNSNSNANTRNTRSRTRLFHYADTVVSTPQSQSQIPPQQQQQQQEQLPLPYDDYTYYTYTINGDTTTAYQHSDKTLDSTTSSTVPPYNTSSTTINSNNNRNRNSYRNSNDTTSTTGTHEDHLPTSNHEAIVRYNQFVLSQLMTPTTATSTTNTKTTTNTNIAVLSEETNNTKPTLVNYAAYEVLRKLNDLGSNIDLVDMMLDDVTLLTISDIRHYHHCNYRTYNKALIFYAVSHYTTCLRLCIACLRHPLQQQRQSSNSNTQQTTLGRNDMILFHIAFLVLECILKLGVGETKMEWNHLIRKILLHGNNEQATSAVPAFIPTIEQIVTWLDDVANTFEDEPTNHITGIEQAIIKFLIPLYKSRLALAECNDGTTTRTESATRLAKKELKMAMELFHHKLRPAYETMTTNHNNHIHKSGGSSSSIPPSIETDSVTSSVNSTDERERNQSLRPKSATTNADPHQSLSSSPSTTASLSPLMKLNQSALCVKAHLEQCKGNTKKSLILCTEALCTTMNTSSGTLNDTNATATGTGTTIHDDGVPVTSATSSDTTGSTYDAIHANNLAVVYATSDRKHLALHGMVKALQANSAIMSKDTLTTMATYPISRLDLTFSNLFLPDGTVQPDMTPMLLYNAAICSSRTRHYTSAYECMVASLCSTSGSDDGNDDDNIGPMFQNRTKCYLHLAEACIGIHSQQQEKTQQASSNDETNLSCNRIQFATVEVDGSVFLLYECLRIFSTTELISLFCNTDF